MLLKILIIAVIILAIITAARLMKVFEFTAVLRGRKPYEISESENNFNAVLVLLSLVGMFGMFIYLTKTYYNDTYILPEAASEHGAEVDALLELNFYVITLAFFITQTLLMWFAYKYRYNKTRKALHYAHNNKLELIWTAVPAVVMAVLVLKGLLVWNHTTNPENDPNKITIELYARQFDWTARYAGDDKTLGDANYTMINANNSLGLITPSLIDEQIVLLKEDIARLEDEQKNKFPGAERVEELKVELRRKRQQLQRVQRFKYEIKEKKFTTANDDIVLQNEIHIPVGRTIELKMRSQDVIHSAYLPHFRVHMYCVPGVSTNFTFKPTITTAQMRSKLGKPEFNYLLYCNNICGSAHFNMLMKVVVESEEEYAAWMKEQKNFGTLTAERLMPPAVDSVSAPKDSVPVTAANFK